MEETWKDVVGFEGYYKVSNNGKVKSVDRYVDGKLNSKRFQKGKPMTIQKSKKGYCVIVLHKNNQYYQKQVHRLVAESFIENTYNKEQVNHLDMNKDNNRADNLEWCTNLENMRHSYSNGNHGGFNENKLIAVRKNQLIAAKKREISVVQFDLKMNLINTFNSITEASILTKSCASKISSCCRGNRKTCNGFIWKYKKQLGGNLKWDLDKTVTQRYGDLRTKEIIQ